MWGKALKRHQGSQVTLPWDLHGVRPSRGNLVVVMGSPGVGKSLFGLNWCLGIDQPSILVSLDTDMATQAMRACSILAGVPEEQVEKRPEAWAQFLDQKNLLCRMYDLSVTPRDVQDIIEAETEYWGVTPGLVVVDNVANIVKESGFEAYRTTFIALQKVARLSGVVVVALHHVKRDSAVGALSLHSGQYAGEQEAELVLGLWRSPTDHGAIHAGILKNRNGPSDPTGGLFKRLWLSPQTLRLKGE